MTAGGTPFWPDPRTRDEHFRKHRRQLGVRTIAQYESSALETIREGVRFEHYGPPVDKWRVGYFDPSTHRFTALDQDDREIQTHFRATESYVRDPVRSTYPL